MQIRTAYRIVQRLELAPNIKEKILYGAVLNTLFIFGRIYHEFVCYLGDTILQQNSSDLVTAFLSVTQTTKSPSKAPVGQKITHQHSILKPNMGARETTVCRQNNPNSCSIAYSIRIPNDFYCAWNDRKHRTKILL